MFILETYSDPWNYTFIIVALIAIGIGTFLAIRNMNRDLLKKRREQRSKDTPVIQSDNNQANIVNNENIEKKDTSEQLNNTNNDIVFHDQKEDTASINITDTTSDNVLDNNTTNTEIDIDDTIEPLKKKNTDNIESHENINVNENISNDIQNKIVNQANTISNHKNQKNNKYKYNKYHKNNKYYNNNRNR